MSKKYDIAAEIAALAASGVDMSVGKTGSGGGDYTPPAKGLARARFIGYYEVGVHEVDEINDAGNKTGNKIDVDQVQLVFELSGPNHPPKKLDDGTLIPQRITIKDLKKSTHEKAGFFKLFTMMNYEGKATHMAQLLGKPFLVKIYHKTAKNGKVYAQMKGAKGTDPVGDGFSISGPTVQDAETGLDKVIEVAEAITPLRLYIFDTSNKAMWDSLFIEGEYPERKDEKTGKVFPARTKNVLQEKIKAAKNFAQSPIGQMLAAGADRELDTPDVDKVPPVDTDDEDGLDDIPF